MTITYAPTNPVVGDTVTFTVTNGAGLVTPNNRFNITAKPSASALSTGMVVADDGTYPAFFAPDVPGVFSVTGYQYENYSAPPMFAGDPGGEARDVLGSVQTVSVNVGEELLFPIVSIFGDSLDLRIVVVDDQVVEATIVTPSSERARLAALDATVTAALTGLVGNAIEDIGRVLYAEVNELLAEYTAHIAEGSTIHGIADSVNGSTKENATSNATAVDVLNDVTEKLYAHMVTSTAGGTWHTTSDTLNSRAAPKATSIAGARVLCSDIRYRVYTRHLAQIASPAAHGSADATNALAASMPLDDVTVAVLDFLAKDQPTAPAQENSGATTAITRFGFRK